MALDRRFPVDDGIVDGVVDGVRDDELVLASSRILLVDSDMPCEGVDDDGLYLVCPKLP